MAAPAVNYNNDAVEHSPTPSYNSNSNSQLHQQNGTMAGQQGQQLSAAQNAKNTLDEMDNAGISKFHLKTVLIAGSGFLCDGYDLQCIGMLTNLLGRLYYPDWTYWSQDMCRADGSFAAGQVPGYLQAANQAGSAKYLKCGSNYNSKIAVNPNFVANHLQHIPSAMPLGINFAINGVALCGTLAGQLIFGYLGDKFGRRSMFVVSLAIMIIFAFMQGLTLGPGTPSFIWSLTWFRFCLGIGIGGDYPLSATLMSEYGSKSNRGALIAAVFAMQGTGYLLASGWVAAMGAAFKGTGANPDYLWRVVLMFGAFPTLLSMWSRITMPESPRYTLFNQGQASNMVADMRTVLVDDGSAFDADRARRAAATGRVKVDSRTYGDFFRQYGLILVGTAGSWFLLDIAFYSQGLYQSVIYQNIGWVASSYSLTPADECLQLAKAQTYVNLASTIPGYWFTVFTVEHLGRWKIQMGGFIMMTLFMSLLAGLYNELYYNVPVFIGLYCMTFFFANWGPNATTFVLPAECYPAKFRAFGHGFSAACGKAGSIIGTFGFKYMTLYTGATLAARPGFAAAQSLGPSLGLLAGCLGLGIATTLLVPETKGKSLEELGADIPVDDESAELAHMNQMAQAKDVDYYSSPVKHEGGYESNYAQPQKTVV